MFTEQERQHIIDALDMAIKSNKRMQVSKPQFKTVFDQLDAELQTLSAKIKNIKITPNK